MYILGGRFGGESGGGNGQDTMMDRCSEWMGLMIPEKLVISK
jgi:hypothetical protein